MKRRNQNPSQKNTSSEQDSHPTQWKLLLGVLALSALVVFSMRNEVSGMNFNIPYYSVRNPSLRQTLVEDTTAPTKTWQPKTQAVSCHGTMETVDAGLYKAQYGEDKQLMQWFGHLCNGTYMEMGALDGVTFSNSHVFHFGLGWKGLLLEAAPRNYKELVKNRPNELALVHAGVCAEAMDLHWVEGKWTATGGFLELASEFHIDKLFPDANIENAQVVRCQRLGDILRNEMKEEHLFFDFYSLDVEGAEYAALQTIDFDKVSFGIIFVEASGQNLMKDSAVQTLLESKGYRYLESVGRGKVTESNWFINKDWHNILVEIITHD